MVSSVHFAGSSPTSSPRVIQGDAIPNRSGISKKTPAATQNNALRFTLHQHVSADPTAQTNVTSIRSAQLISASDVIAVQQRAETTPPPYVFTLSPGQQTQTVDALFQKDDLLRAALDSKAISENFYQPASTEITRRLLQHYQEQPRFAEALKALGQSPSAVFLTKQGIVKERLDPDEAVIQTMKTLQEGMTPAENQKLLTQVLAEGIRLAPDLDHKAAQDITLALVETARNAPEMLDSLNQLSRDGTIEYGLIHDEGHPLGLKYDIHQDTSKNWRVLLSSKIADLPPIKRSLFTSLLTFTAQGLKNGVPQAQELAAIAAREIFADPDQPFIQGLLPPQLVDPLVQLGKEARQLRAQAQKIDQLFNDAEPGFEKRLGDMYKDFFLLRTKMLATRQEVFEKHIQPLAEPHEPQDQIPNSIEQLLTNPQKL